MSYVRLMARALAFVPADRDHDRRATEIFDQARRGQADDARRPLRIGDHRGPRVGPIPGPLARALDDLTGQLLPFAVALVTSPASFTIRK